jgi:hypothetical protein
MGRRKAARDEAVGRAAFAFAVSVALLLLVGAAVGADGDGLVAASLLVAAGAADDRCLWLLVVVVVAIVLCGRRCSSARRRNILIGAMILCNKPASLNGKKMGDLFSSTLNQDSQTNKHTLVGIVVDVDDDGDGEQDRSSPSPIVDGRLASWMELSYLLLMLRCAEFCGFVLFVRLSSVGGTASDDTRPLRMHTLDGLIRLEYTETKLSRIWIT